MYEMGRENYVWNVNCINVFFDGCVREKSMDAGKGVNKI